MMKAKFNYPDLDVLEEPLVSPTPLTSVGGIPGSAIAEKIFNDPDSWEENDADFPQDPSQDPLASLIDDIEHFGGNSHHVHSLSSAISPSSSSSSAIYTPLNVNTEPTVATSTEAGPSPLIMYSGSTTLSFLEWYGISSRHALPESSLVNSSPSKDAFSSPTGKRMSSLLPPGLDSLTPSPPLVPHPQSPAPPSRLPKPSTSLVNSEVPSAYSLPITCTPSPVRSRHDSISSSRSNSNSPPRSRTGTPARGTSDSDLNGRRRLPSIPLDPSVGTISSPQPQVHTPALVSSRWASPSPLPLRSSTAPPSSLPTGTFASPALTPQLQRSISRPLSSVRSPLVGPAGPRTRSSQGRMSKQDTGTPRGSLVHRPPVLRL